MGMLRFLVRMLGYAFMAYYVMVLARNIVTAIAAYEMDKVHLLFSDGQTVFSLFVRPILDAIIVYSLFWVLLPRRARNRLVSSLLYVSSLLSYMPCEIPIMKHIN